MNLQGSAPAAATLAAAALLLAGCGGGDAVSTQPLLAPTDAAAPDDAATGPAAEPVALHHECVGSGSPTVVLEAGFGSASEDWQAFQQQLASLTRVCRYDRAGLGQSRLPDAAAARTAADQVEDLAALLDRVGIAPPYVLAGHSYGGVLGRLFADRNRGDVAGLVLAESPHPDEREQFLAVLPDSDDPVVARLRTQLTTSFGPETNPERIDWDAAMEEARAVRDLGDVPLVVITGGQAGPRAVAGIEPELADELEEVRLELQGELARLSANGIHVVATSSGHAIADPRAGQPEVLRTAIEAVVRSARLLVPLPPCEALFAQAQTRCVDVG